MKQYEKYIDSGTQWLGKVPNHWILLPLKHYVSFIKGRTPSEISDVAEGFPYLTMDYLRGRSDKQTMYPKNPNDLILVNDGDIIVLWDGANAGEFLRAKKGYLGSTMAKIIFDESKYEKSYFYYLLYSLTKIAKKFANGTTIPHFDSKVLTDYTYPCPTFNEQCIIASYLDIKVWQIDSIIAEKEAMIEDMQNYRKSIITEAVTRGMNPNTPMKESGIESIGAIPSNWKVVPIKYVLSQSGDGIKMGPFGSTLTGKVSPDNKVKVYGQWNVIGKDFNAGKNFVSEETYQELESYWIHPNDILISMMGTVGKCAIIPQGVAKGIMDSHIVKVRLNENIITPQYFYYVYDKDGSNVVMSQIQRDRRGSIMDGLNSSLIKNFYITLPPLDSQEQICKYLDKKVEIFDKSISELQYQIEDLKAYKASIITEAVTGKIDLR